VAVVKALPSKMKPLPLAFYLHMRGQMQRGQMQRGQMQRGQMQRGQMLRDLEQTSRGERIGG